jgi:branched-chain amino acid transport system ATP-binding protein
MTAMLEVAGLHARYGQVEVLRGLDFDVAAGEIVVMLGANGAGKTTTLRALCAMVHASGSIRIEGDEVLGARTPEIARRGVAHVPQGRGTFASLSVLDNLRMGGYQLPSAEVDDEAERWFAMFPRLGERRAQVAGSLSGGEQQMLALARAMMSRPRLLLLDEPSLGLAPLVVADLFHRLATLNAETGTTMLIVEQNAELALDIAHRGYVLEAGEIVLSGPAADLQADDAVRAAYLGA